MRILSRVFDVNPVLRGIEEWFVVAALTAAGLGLVSALLLPHPSAALMRDIANIGIVLVLAFAVEAAWLAPHVADGSSKDDKEEMGRLLGLGLAGLLGVVVAVLVSAHRAAGHGNLLDDFGLGWAVASLTALGLMVVLHPWLVHVWEDKRGSST